MTPRTDIPASIPSATLSATSHRSFLHVSYELLYDHDLNWNALFNFYERDDGSTMYSDGQGGEIDYPKGKLMVTDWTDHEGCLALIVRNDSVYIPGEERIAGSDDTGSCFSDDSEKDAVTTVLVGIYLGISPEDAKCFAIVERYERDSKIATIRAGYGLGVSEDDDIEPVTLQVLRELPETYFEVRFKCIRAATIVQRWWRNQLSTRTKARAKAALMIQAWWKEILARPPHGLHYRQAMQRLTTRAVACARTNRA